MGESLINYLRYRYNNDVVHTHTQVLFCIVTPAPQDLVQGDQSSHSLHIPTTSSNVTSFVSDEGKLYNVQKILTKCNSINQ